MAERYYITFTDYRLSINDSTFNGTATELHGSGRSPVVLTWDSQEDDVPGPIRSLRCDISIIDYGSTPIGSFLSEDELRFTVEFKNTATNTTLFKGFISQEDSQQPYIFEPRTITLTATDGLGLLKDKKLSDTATLAQNNVHKRVKVIDYFKECLVLTGHTLPINAYVNLFEERMTKRATVATACPLDQAYIKNSTFIYDSDFDDWGDCYSTLEAILSDWRCTLYQRNGEWTILRWLDDLTNPPGTTYLVNGTVAVAPVFSSASNLYPTDRNQVNMIKRPMKSLKTEKEYFIPVLLRNKNLTRLGTFIEKIDLDLDNDTFLDHTWEHYQLDQWTNRNTQTGYIRIVRNYELQNELERYIVHNFRSDLTNHPSIRSNAIEVNKGDRFRFAFQFRAPTDGNYRLDVRVGFLLIGYNGSKRLLARPAQYTITGTPNPNPNKKYSWAWTTVTNPNINDNNQAWSWLMSLPGEEDHMEWVTFDTEEFVKDDLPMQRFPFDGTLYISLWGASNDSGSSNPRDVDIWMRDFEFDYYLFIRESTQIEGHTNFIDQAASARKIVERNVIHDDTVKTNIGGTLFLSDVNGEPRRAEQWTTGKYRFGEISAMQEQIFEYLVQDKLEGDFLNLCDMNTFYTLPEYPGKRFMPVTMSVDYGTGLSNAVFIEVSNTAKTITIDDIKTRYKFDYKFKK